jgi:putative N6-adenine-specific DNA methylase
MYRLFAVTQPGFEPLVHRELLSMGLTTPAQSPENKHPTLVELGGGVEFDAALTDLYSANLYLRTPNRVLCRLGQPFETTAFADLRKKAAHLPWHQFLRPGQPVAIRVTCHKSKLYHSDGVAERIAGAIGDCLKQPAPLVKADDEADGSPQLVVARIDHDLCTLSIDTSGAMLHRRGYRLATAKAPLRETLAATLLLAAGWKPDSPLIDPFCGSGTIPIEAALLARRVAPGKNRHFAFMDWPNFDAALWKTLVEQAVAGELAAGGPILASDRDAGAIKMAQENAQRAGVSDSISFNCQAFSAIQPPATPGWMITNPPYGVRVSSGNDLRNLYAQLGNVLHTLCPGWQVGILCNSSYLMGHTHLNFSRQIHLVNGGIPVKFFIGRVKSLKD